MKKEPVCELPATPQYYRIGVFSQLNRVTIKTLRHYDDIGILKPAYVDEVSGYRYYTSAQLPQLHKILALKEMDFSLEEIKRIFQGASEEYLLKKRKQQLLLQMAQCSEKLAKVEGYLNGDYLGEDYRIIMKPLPEVIIASMHVVLPDYQALFTKMPEMGILMEEAGCVCVEPDYCFTIYHDGEYREQDVDAQICQAVMERKEDHGALHFEVLPAVEMAACVLHKGSYRTLPNAYHAILQYIEESGYELAGKQRESYIDGVWNKEREEDWLTEIQFPVRKRSR